MKRSIQLILGGLCALALYCAFLNHVEPSEIGLARNLVTGKVWVQRAGWHVTPPWVLVARIDTRPTRVCVESAGRAVNCRLVRFVPEAYREFVVVEGFRYYWWDNRLSFNWGYREEYRGMRDVLRGYAFSEKKYPFIEIIE